MTLNIINKDSRWDAIAWDIHAIIEGILSTTNQPGEEVAVVLTDDKTINELNHQFRQKNRPTNVLSFPSDADGEYGDIILSYDTIANEAGEQSKSFQAHATHMLVHGMLHLLGYDHQDDAEAEQMEQLEIFILQRLGIANPYLTD